MAIVSSGQLTLTDLNDNKQLIIYLNANYRTQVYDPNNTTYSPNFTSTNLVITPELYIAGGGGANLLPTPQVQSLTWYEGNQTTTPLAETATTGTTGNGYTYNIPTGAVGTTAKPFTLKSNLTSASQIYTCVIVYRDPDTSFDVTVKASIDIVKITNGAKGQDGTGANAIQGVLSNDNHSVPSDSAGGSQIVTGAVSTLSIFEGSTDVTSSWNMGTPVVTGATGTFSGSPTNRTFTLTSMTSDSATVVWTATKAGSPNIVKQFTLVRVKSGTNGSNGSDSTSYWMTVDASAIQKSASGTYTPSSINITAKSQVGAGTPANYSGKFTVDDSTDGSTYTNRYTSASNEATKNYVPSAGIKTLRVRLHQAGVTPNGSNHIDEQIIPIVADGVDVYTSILSNDSVVFPADKNGNVSSYANNVTTLKIYKGATDDTANWTISQARSTGVTVTEATTSATATVTALAQANDTGSVTFTATKASAPTQTKVFTLSKSKTGQDPTAYWLVSDTSAIQKSVGGVYTPASINLTAKSQLGSGTPGNYSGRFQIWESTDGGSTWGTAKYTSSGNEATKNYVPSASISAVKVQLYLAGGTTTLLDEQIIPIVADGTNGSNGSNGVDAYYLNVWCPNGDTVRNSGGNISVTADLYKGGSTVTPTAFKWYQQDPNATTGSGGDTDGGNGWRLINGVSDATTAPTLALQSNTGTRMVAQTYFVRYTWVGLSGETLASSEASLAVTANNDLKVTIPVFPSGVTRAKVYIGTVTGATNLKYQGDITTSAGNIVLSKYDSTTVAPPTSSTASTAIVTSATITVVPQSIQGIEGFKCVATAPTTGTKYSGLTIVKDFQDPIAVNIIGASVLKNGQGSTTLTAQLIQNGVEISTNGYTFAWALYNQNGSLNKTLSGSGDTITVLNSDFDGVNNLVVDVSK